MGSIPVLRRPPWGGNGNPLQYSCLENPMNREPGGPQSTGWVRKELDMTEHAHMWSSVEYWWKHKCTGFCGVMWNLLWRTVLYDHGGWEFPPTVWKLEAQESWWYKFQSKSEGRRTRSTYGIKSQSQSRLVSCSSRRREWIQPFSTYLSNSAPQ